MAYLIDTNIFVTAKNFHYGLDFCPGFWDWLVEANRSGKLLSIDAVYDELLVQEDQLAEWAKARAADFFVAPAETDFDALTRVTRWTNDHPKYEAVAKQTFLAEADYFVVAQALAGGHTVVTHEVFADSAKRIKIPNACIGLKVKCITPWQMLRAERARFVLRGTGPGWPDEFSEPSGGDS